MYEQQLHNFFLHFTMFLIDSRLQQIFESTTVSFWIRLDMYSYSSFRNCTFTMNIIYYCCGMLYFSQKSNMPLATCKPTLALQQNSLLSIFHKKVSPLIFHTTICKWKKHAFLLWNFSSCFSLQIWFFPTDKWMSLYSNIFEKLYSSIYFNKTGKLQLMIR